MDECYESGTDGERLVCKIVSKVLNTKGATWKATGSSAESSLAADHVSGILCISLKLQIRAVVWKRGAHQPGGPPLRTTAARHFRSSPPGMDANARGVSLCNILGPHKCASNGTEATGSPSRRIEIVAWGGDTLPRSPKQ